MGDETDRWDAEIERLSLRLDEHRRDRDSSAPGSALYQDEQHEADQVHYRLRAYRLARPVLTGLYDDLAREHRRNWTHRDQALADAGFWIRLAAGAGLAGAVLLLTGFGTSVPWWVAVAGFAAVAGCVVAAGAAVASHRDYPDAGLSEALSARIDEIRRACHRCDSHEGLDRVQALVNPRPGSAVATRVL